LPSHSYHPTLTGHRFATVLLPLAIQKPYTYSVPPEWQKEISFGKRVEVQFGRNKIYAGLVIELSEEKPEGLQPKPVLSVIDKDPILHPAQIKFWHWIARYYACTMGEIMAAALPAGLKLSSETLIVPSPFFEDHIGLLKGKEFLVAEALENREELSLEDIQKILGQKTVYPVIHSLLEKKLIFLKEELKRSYKPKKVSCVRLQEPFRSQPELLEEAFDMLSRATRQVEALMAFLQLEKKDKHVRKSAVYQKAQVNSSILKAMEKKGIFELYELEISRLGGYEDELTEAPELSEQQIRALDEIKGCFSEKNVCLLHGVTGSGKTRIYMELIRECIERGEQALYLLPEIALTTQLVNRLQRIFGDDISVYHSRLNNSERVEVWQEVAKGKPLIMGARSGLFLPFKKLKLIIVDEEHDPSFKQYDPAPRYHARDSAIYLATQLGAKVLLGTATPSLESYYNAKHKKYGLVEMPERFGGIDLPEMIIADKRKEAKDRKMQSHFTSLLIEAMQEALNKQEQVILFQNRRGYAPSINCNVCGWNQQCINCDVSLTYHKHSQNMRCHYCGYQSAIPSECPACGNQALHLQGFGTEKVEDELKIYLPEARIARMDFDTVRGKQAYAKLIHDFEERRIDILVGTQMVTKGLDFDNVGIVGILSADHLLQFPDFRASERAFQLITQVAGRAGRKNKGGKVIIQAFNPEHPVIQEAFHYNFQRFYRREIMERQSFHYPPFNRVITVTLKHKKPEVLNRAMQYYHHLVTQNWKPYVIGPSLPPIPRIRTYYLLQILIKLPANNQLLGPVKKHLQEAAVKTRAEDGCSQLRVSIDVDPY
jgi:primosomal protein N' (replication factor Y)